MFKYEIKNYEVLENNTILVIKYYHNNKELNNNNFRNPKGKFLFFLDIEDNIGIGFSRYNNIKICVFSNNNKAIKLSLNYEDFNIDIEKITDKEGSLKFTKNIKKNDYQLQGFKYELKKLSRMINKNLDVINILEKHSLKCIFLEIIFVLILLIVEILLLKRILNQKVNFIN